MTEQNEQQHENLVFLLSAPPVQTFCAREIISLIPHRYPFLLVDRVDIIEPRRFALGTKCVTINEPFFQGHFPGNPVMPGVLALEAMAQTCATLTMSIPEFRGKMAFFMSIDNAKFRQPLLPGTTLKMALEILRLGRAGKTHGETYVDGKLAVEADMTFVFAEVDK